MLCCLLLVFTFCKIRLHETKTLDVYRPTCCMVTVICLNRINILVAYLILKYMTEVKNVEDRHIDTYRSSIL